jgi:hypothetical protein
MTTFASFWLPDGLYRRESLSIPATDSYNVRPEVHEVKALLCSLQNLLRTDAEHTSIFASVMSSLENPGDGFLYSRFVGVIQWGEAHGAAQIVWPNEQHVCDSAGSTSPDFVEGKVGIV